MSDNYVIGSTNLALVDIEFAMALDFGYSN
jgi:hypothetical protein